MTQDTQTISIEQLLAKINEADEDTYKEVLKFGMHLSNEKFNQTTDNVIKQATIWMILSSVGTILCLFMEIYITRLFNLTSSESLWGVSLIVFVLVALIPGSYFLKCLYFLFASDDIKNTLNTHDEVDRKRIMDLANATEESKIANAWKQHITINGRIITRADAEIIELLHGEFNDNTVKEIELANKFMSLNGAN